MANGLSFGQGTFLNEQADGRTYIFLEDSSIWQGDMRGWMTNGSLPKPQIPTG